MSCNTKLAGEFTRACGFKPKQGVDEKWYGNWEDIDREATVLANRNTKITTLVLKEDAKLYKAAGNDKSHKAKHALAVGDYGNGYIHTDEYIPMYIGDNEAQRIQELVEGARVFTIEKMVDTGVSGETTFKVAGFESGMLITNDDYDSSANSGTSTIICATKEGEEEATRLKTFLLAGGVAATQAWIDANTYVPAP
ncbi:hypothetical protein [Flavobacterium sedimenticola]|uniref:Uncharacterized protein n=1 Tax=Flavobacterium sedimenticola TaxID=3043286 RepID=A0ABT6XMW5_9FLAO|nr:hypothetical protein [Flavobacterium sedimenticola]MDI9256320.1 hypothetical protein [Flavobacterium sedimenticola]